MKNSKFFYVYLAGGFIGLIMIVVDIARSCPALKAPSLISDVAIGLIFFYLAYKAYHEKKDQEMM